MAAPLHHHLSSLVLAAAALLLLLPACSPPGARAQVPVPWDTGDAYQSPPPPARPRIRQLRRPPPPPDAPPPPSPLAPKRPPFRQRRPPPPRPAFPNFPAFPHFPPGVPPPSPPPSPPPPRFRFPTRQPPSPKPPPPFDESQRNVPAAPPKAPALPPMRLRPSPPPVTPQSLRDIGQYVLHGIGMIVAVHMAAIPGTDKYLFMERPSGYHPDGTNTIAGYYDLTNAKFTHIKSPDGLFCCGHSFLDSGDVVIIGGHQANAGYPDGMKSVRIFDKSTTILELQKITEMGWKRWYPSITLLPNGQVLIMGGTQGVGAGTANNPFYEIYDHRTRRTTPFKMNTDYLESAKQVYYPFNYVLPSGDLFTFCGRAGYVINPYTNTWITAVPKLRGYATTEFPYTGTSVMLPLLPEKNYQVEIMLFGGQKELANQNLSIPANKNANRIRVLYDGPGQYSFDGWVEEPMLASRVMPDSVLLPNGKVVVMDGAMTGLAGDSASGGDTRADFPQLFAELYNPDEKWGQRFRPLARTRIPRMYHSTACLTSSGTIIVAGCDRCAKYEVGSEFVYDPSGSKAEYRVEVYSPPFFFFDELKPTIRSLEDDVMPYKGAFTIRYAFPSQATRAAGRLAVTQVVLVAPCSVTHSFNTHQRVIGLVIQDDDNVGTLTVIGPPNINIAPPGMYMVFLLNGDIYSTAEWVTLRRPGSST